MRTLFLSLVILGCSHSEKSTSAPLPIEKKPMALVLAVSQFEATQKTLTVTFEAAATDVTFSVNGLDGFKVSTIPNARAQVDFAARETHTIELKLEKENSSGTVALNVTGFFNGAKQTRVMTFDIGMPKAVDSSGTVVKDSTGDSLKIKVVK